MKRLIQCLLIAAVVALVGCAHSGAISKSPCACDFHTLAIVG
ncbi:hypothetical protein AWB78_07365 [Caballeronia calidae]|uniref:Lipoprotein n=1 Tax=Caballeronia calidae TaxID=1777139 RepID=A0A158EET1_9BURK|nr:hypothetical protein AWB78_07365 [Caballeronia calidae]